MSDNIKKYSVIILTHLPHDELIISIEKLLTQKILPEKIIIYNTNLVSFFKNIKDRLKLERLLYDNKNYIQLIHIDEKDFDHGKARNDAMKLVDTDYVLFLTDDAIPYNDELSENLLNAFTKYEKDSKVAIAYARQLAKNNATLKEKYIREYNYPTYDIIKNKENEAKLGIKNYFCSNVCAMYDRNIFNKLLGFEENIILNEDTFYAYKAINNGYKVIYTSNAIVCHSHNYSYKEQLSRNFDIGVSQAEKYEIFKNIPSYNEGMKLIKYVCFNLIKGLHIFMIVDFLIECCFRLYGFKKGLHFKSLSNDECIRYASNKNYFLKKETKL